jgi:glycosyltransferase involved in cell wall biosynthesis
VAENSFVKKIGHDPDPLLTVAMPIYNAGHQLRLAVLSIVHQSFKDWELLIIDDGSTDNALQYLDGINDSRIHIMRDGRNKGLAARLNEAIGMARGRYFARMDQDDVSYPERFERQIELLQRDPVLDVVAASAIAISDDNEVAGLLPCPVSHEAICDRPWQAFCFAHPTWMGRIEWFRKHKYSIPGPYFCEDQELLLRSYGESKFGATREILFAYRIGNRNNWGRVVRTRWAFFMIQFRHFGKLNKFHFQALAMLVLVALVVRDYTRMVRQNFKFQQGAPSDIDHVVTRTWHETLNVITKNPC